MAADSKHFAFQAFADAPSAQAAFAAVYPVGAPIEPALQALVNMGARCRNVGPNRFACRYIESETALAGFCWHVALDSDDRKAIQRVAMALAMLAV
jgi:hypothetical protein